MFGNARTLGTLIELTAKQTGASVPFVDKIRSLFTRRGITMASDPRLFRDDVTSAFQQQEQIRQSSQQIQQSLSLALQQVWKLERMGVQSVMNLGEIRDGMKRHSQSVHLATNQMALLALMGLARKLGVRLHIDH